MFELLCRKPKICFTEHQAIYSQKTHLIATNKSFFSLTGKIKPTPTFTESFIIMTRTKYLNAKTITGH